MPGATLADLRTALHLTPLSVADAGPAAAADAPVGCPLDDETHFVLTSISKSREDINED